MANDQYLLEESELGIEDEEEDEDDELEDEDGSGTPKDLLGEDEDELVG